jgi:ADP-ribose pyrophosphatase YjhB (NUDIX family)
MVAGVKVAVPRLRVGVAVVALDGQERVLLLRHVFHPTAPWGLPGGWLGRRESPMAGAQRELREETGLEAWLGPVLHVASDSTPSQITIAYLARVQADPMRLSAEIIEAGWFSPTALPRPMFPFVYQAIAAAGRYLHAEGSHSGAGPFYPVPRRLPKESKELVENE